MTKSKNACRNWRPTAYIDFEPARILRLFYRLKLKVSIPLHYIFRLFTRTFFDPTSCKAS